MKALLIILLSCSLAGAASILVLSGRPPAASAASVTIDTSALGTSGTGLSTMTINITVGSNSNRVLYVGAGSGTPSGADTITSISSNVSGAFTEVAQATDSTWANGQIWRLVNPATGAHVITVNVAAANQSACAAISLYNVDQSTPNGTASTANGTGASPSASVTLASTSMAVGFIATDSETGLSVSVGTQRQEVENVGTDTAYSLATNTGSGSTAITWAQPSAIYAVVVVPVNGAP